MPVIQLELAANEAQEREQSLSSNHQHDRHHFERNGPVHDPSHEDYPCS